jgi:hypothetical protein
MDLGGMMLLVIGGGCYLRAYFGLEAIRLNGGVAANTRFAALAEFERYYQLSRFGLGLAAVAILVLLASAAMAWRVRRAPPAEVPLGEPASLWVRKPRARSSGDDSTAR